MFFEIPTDRKEKLFSTRRAVSVETQNAPMGTKPGTGTLPDMWGPEMSTASLGVFVRDLQRNGTQDSSRYRCSSTYSASRAGSVAQEVKPSA
jgi:hypothetical protein